ncbi:MAG: hypothetical protein AB7V50_04760 [Vampirovibrionia bacterium]
MINKFKSVVMIAFVFILVAALPVLSEVNPSVNSIRDQNVQAKSAPTSEDVKFAGDFYYFFRSVVDYNNNLKEDLVIEDDYDKSIAVIKEVMNRRLEYAKKTISDLESIKPTDKFVSCYNTVLEALKLDVTYVKQILKMCDEKASIEDINNFENTINQTNESFMNAKEELVKVVKSWEEKYVQQVEEIYSEHQK